MNNFILGFYLLLTTHAFLFGLCNLPVSTQKNKIWFADTNLDPTQTTSGFSRQETHAEESEETVQVIPHDPFSGGEEISAETMELKRRKQEKKSGSIEWKVTSKPENSSSKSKLTLRNYPHRGKYSKGAAISGSGSAPVAAVAKAQLPPQPIILDPPLEKILKENTTKPKVSRTVRYRTWVSNYSISDFDPNNQSDIGLPADHIYSPSNKKTVRRLIPDSESVYVPSKQKRPVLYYIPKKSMSHDEDRRNSDKHRYAYQPIDYEDDSYESDESDSMEDMPFSYRRFLRYQFTPPKAPKAPTPVYKPQTTPQTAAQAAAQTVAQTAEQTTTAMPAQSLSTQQSVTNIQFASAAQLPITVSTLSTASTASLTQAEASYKKQTYMDHPIAYLMSHLPTSTYPALPTHAAELSLSAGIVSVESSKATPVPFTGTSPAPIPIATNANLPPVVVGTTENPPVNIRPTENPPVHLRPTENPPVRFRPSENPPVRLRPTENSLESAESESSEEYDDEQENEDPRPSKNRPAVDYDNEEEDYSDEDYEEPEPLPPPKPKKGRSKKIYYRKRPVNVNPVDYQDYDSVETADRKRPVTVYVERLPPRPHKKHVNPKTIYYVKGGQFPTRPRHHSRRVNRRPPLQLVQTADGQQFYIANNWLEPHKNPNLVIAYEQPPLNSSEKFPNAFLNSESQYTNHPGKIKWLNQLDQFKDISKPTIIYQQVSPGVSLPPFTHPLQPYQAITDPRMVQYPILVGNSSNKHQGVQQLLLPSIPKRTKTTIHKIAAPTQTKLNHLEDDGFYALMDSNGRLTPAKLVLTKPKSEKIYNVVETRHKQPKLESYKCDWSNCQLPDCFCGTNVFIPGNLKVSEVPQMILLTFDDSVNEVNYPFYYSLLASKKNPNGCPVSATFFVSNEWTDYSEIQNLYSQGHEMASHSISHGDGGRFNRQKWEEEILGQKEILKTLGGVKGDDVQGMRAPFLQPGGDNQFTMLQLSNFTYDSSLPVRRTDPPIWPYTLDFGIPHECNIPPCPKRYYPGLWEVPLVMWTDLTGGRCSMADACTTPTNSDDIYRMLMRNFEHHYNSNRSPFPMYFHYAWFTKSQNLEAFTTFIDTILQLRDVYLVSMSKMIEWMKHPTPLSNIHQFVPWKCLNQTQSLCLKPQTCSFILANGKEKSARSCQPCASNFKVGK